MFYETIMEVAYGNHLMERLVVLLFLLTLRAQTAAALTYYNTSNGAVYINPGSNTMLSWPDAQSYCKSLSSTLGVCDTPNQRQSFIEALNSFGLYNTDIWLGANASYGAANDWRWLNGANYTGPAVQGVSNFSYSYVTISKPQTSVNVNTVLGVYVFSYLCQYPTSSSACASGGRLLFTSYSSCYVASTEVTDWFNARNNCLSNGGDLAVFPDLNSISQYLNGTQYWIGLRSSFWSWQNAETGASYDVTYSFWANKQPNDDTADCMSIRSGSASDDTCNITFNFICQKGVASSATSSVAYPTSSGSLPLRSSSSRITTKSTSTSTFPTPLSILLNSLATFSSVSSSVETSSGYPSEVIEAATQTTSLGVIIGIAVGVGVPVIAITIIVIVVIVVCRRQNERKAEERNTRDQSVSLPETSQTPPTYMQLQIADSHEYARIGNDYLQLAA